MRKEIPILFDLPEQETKDATIRALWWNQPFASLMLPPFYKDETRKRPTKVRGKVLICACKEPYAFTKVGEISGMEQLNRIFLAFGNSWPVRYSLPTGLAIGIGELVDCYPMKKEHEDKCYVQYKPHLWVWKFDNVQPIEPFPIQGKQGWAILDEETKAKINVLSTTGKNERIINE